MRLMARGGAALCFLICYRTASNCNCPGSRSFADGGTMPSPAGPANTAYSAARRAATI